jgi:fucose permease
MVIFGIVENIKGVSYPLIKTEFNASWEQQGLMVSILSLSYVIFCIIAGLFLGRFGIKPSFLSGLGAISVGLFAIFFSPGFLSAAVCLFVIFAGFGFLEIGINALASSVFTANSALFMNLLHAFYGIGAIIGPKAAGILTNNAGFNWRLVYLLSMPLVFLSFIFSIFLKIPGESKTGNVEKRVTFFDALGRRDVWLMAVILGLGIAVEMSSPNWGALYFQDMYGIDPRTGGAAFLSMFFIFFTVSRLVSGMFVERIGYARSLIGITAVIFVIFIAGFCLGERGIYVLPALGFFIGPFWPTVMAIGIRHFGNDAPVMASAMIAIGGALNSIIQFLVGLTNRFLGPAWGYRSSAIYILICFVLLLVLSKKLQKHENTSVYRRK